MYYHSVSMSKMKFNVSSNNASTHRRSKCPTGENVSNLVDLNLKGDSRFQNELNDSSL